MFSYILRRLLGMIPIILIVTLITSSFLYIIPGDPIRIMYPDVKKEDVEALRKAHGLDKPWLLGYFDYMINLLQGDLGKSIKSKNLITDEVAAKAGPTFYLTIVSMVFALIFGLVVGMISATKRNSVWDRIAMVSAITMLSIPEFWFALLCMNIFAVELGWLPTSGYGSWENYVLPVFTIATGVGAVIARFTRSSILEVLKEDYVRTARAKGQKEAVVLWVHVLRNGMIPVVTMAGVQFGFLIGGSVVVEKIFQWPGLGQYLIDGIILRDYPVIQAMVLLFSIQFLFVNLLVDISYGLLNPQIRYE